VEEMFFALVTQCMDMHVLPKLANAAIISISLDLWMFSVGHG
jgi:hypothetical protein